MKNQPFKFAGKNLMDPNRFMCTTNFSCPNLPPPLFPYEPYPIQVHHHWTATQHPWLKVWLLSFLILLSHRLLLSLNHFTIFKPKHSHRANLTLELEPELNPFLHRWWKLNPLSERRISSSSVLESLALPLQCPSTGSVSKAPWFTKIWPEFLVWIWFLFAHIVSVILITFCIKVAFLTCWAY